jgi:hypothetical protein
MLELGLAEFLDFNRGLSFSKTYTLSFVGCISDNRCIDGNVTAMKSIFAGIARMVT